MMSPPPLESSYRRHCWTRILSLVVLMFVLMIGSTTADSNPDVPLSSADVVDSTSNTTESTTMSSESTENSRQPDSPPDPSQDSSSSSSSSSRRSSTNTNTNTVHPDFIHKTWGTYYDPKNIFCGEFDCYKILGFDYDSFGRDPPSTKEITKRYRGLSREWHPDKSKHKNAKERFVKIVRAYEVLTDKTRRDEYDKMRYNPDLYVAKYGASVLWQYAPKSDVTIIVLFLLCIASAFTYAVQYQKWYNVANRLAKAAIEDWNSSQGGSPESKALREHALQILQEKESTELATNQKNSTTTTNTTTTSSSSHEIDANHNKEDTNKNGTTTMSSSTTPANVTNNNNNSNKILKRKLSSKDKKKQEQDALRPIIMQLVQAMDDFGGGFHKPTWRDVLVVQLVMTWPMVVVSSMVWNVQYYIRRFQNLELNDDEQQVLTQRAVGRVVWETTSDRPALVQRRLWITANLMEWKEEQELKNLSSKEQKQYQKMMKKNKGKSE